MEALLPLRQFFAKMMSRTTKSFAWLWMAALLSASIGVSVQQVYCYCVGKTTVSLFAADEACQAMGKMADQTDACCKKAVPAKKNCCEKPASEHKGCTKKTTQVFQLKTEFEVAKTEFKKISFLDFWTPGISFPSFFQGIKFAQKADFQGFKRQPPTLSGRMICVRHGVSRC